MIGYILTEGSLDKQLLKTVLPEKCLNNVEVVEAGGLYAVKSLARSLLVRRQVPVIIVVDADSVDPEFIQERIENIEQIVKRVAVNTPVKVITAVPEMETIFFQDVSLLSRLLGYTPPQDVLNLASFQPKRALEQLLSQSKEVQNQLQIIAQLKYEGAEILRQAPFIQEIIHFIESVRETAKVS
ncbi:MAG: hypothetical protein RID53_27670 [Coleofasciculus sp. B1-GNL1-01]|uniref:hypothetical protein n=1 Tax=Coleofasciculus sp. B1-GNL1-01 TaxID=3068484 RepID=UPI0032F9E1EE